MVLVADPSSGGTLVDVSRGIAGSGLTNGSVTVLALPPPLHAAGEEDGRGSQRGHAQTGGPRLTSLSARR